MFRRRRTGNWCYRYDWSGRRVLSILLRQYRNVLKEFKEAKFLLVGVGKLEDELKVKSKKLKT